MNPVPESIVYVEIESSLRNTPSSSTWNEVVQLPIADPLSLYWTHYKARLSGVPAGEWAVRNDSELNAVEVGSESLIWKDVNYQLLQTFNKLFPEFKAKHLNDSSCASVSVEKIRGSYIHSVDDDVLLKNSIYVDVICDPLGKKFSEKIGEIGVCCASEFLRSKSKTVPLTYLCGKRTDLSKTTDWVMRRYGGNRRESSMYVNLMWWTTWLEFLTCGKFGVQMVVDFSLGVLTGSTMEMNSSSDGDRLTHHIDKTELADAARASADKSLSPASRLHAGIEAVVASRTAYAKKYKELRDEITGTVDPKHVTPVAYLKSRYADGMFLTMCGAVLAREFGERFDMMTGSIYVEPLETSLHYNDLSDAILDLKYMETQNYVICAKANSNYSFSDHFEALYVALTTFEERYNSLHYTIKRRMLLYRFSVAAYLAIWPRYRTCERARRFVGSLKKAECNKLIEMGRRSIQGDVYIEENMWLNAICSNFNNRRAEIRNRGYTETLLFFLGVQDDPFARDRIHSAVQAIGKRPFNTALELVMSLGSVWLAQLGLRSLKESASYEDLVAELSDVLSTLALSSMPIISDNTITPCDSICGALCLRITEMLGVVSEINTTSGGDIMSTVAVLITMVSLDPYRCIAYQADMLLSN